MLCDVSSRSVKPHGPHGPGRGRAGANIMLPCDGALGGTAAFSEA